MWAHPGEEVAFSLYKVSSAAVRRLNERVGISFSGIVDDITITARNSPLCLRRHYRDPEGNLGRSLGLLSQPVVSACSSNLVLYEIYVSGSQPDVRRKVRIGRLRRVRAGQWGIVAPARQKGKAGRIAR